MKPAKTAGKNQGSVLAKRRVSVEQDKPGFKTVTVVVEKSPEPEFINVEVAIEKNPEPETHQRGDDNGKEY